MILASLNLVSETEEKYTKKIIFGKKINISKIMFKKEYNYNK